ncbi:MAG: ABC transporter ATP-binding protein, partial [Clostridia bacterium]|nr:ABC transporter ATP-binding protein [Clostridia bacterium]
HRLSTILDADRILVLRDGHIVAAGKHAELLETSEDYRTFYDTQFKAKEEEPAPERRAFRNRDDYTEVEESARAWRHSMGRWQTELDAESYY